MHDRPREGWERVVEFMGAKIHELGVAEQPIFSCK
jgi:hypothetical protein